MNGGDWRDALKALCPDLPEGDMDAAEAQSAPSINESQTGRIDIITEKKGRAGKTATIICGLTLSAAATEALASELKRRLGCGGSARGGEILIQGDRRKDVSEFLISKGFKTRLV